MATTKKQPTKPATVQVQAIALTGSNPAKPYRANTARALYWAALKATLQGGAVPCASIAVQWLANPPSTPKAGKLAGQPEPAAGWFGYFVRQGLCKYTTVNVPAKG